MSKIDRFFALLKWKSLGIHIGAKFKMGENNKIWNNSIIRDNVKIGSQCIIGRHVIIDSNVTIKDNVKIQNGSLIYGPANIHSNVFIGPGVITTNDLYPRSVNPDGTLKKAKDWSEMGVEILEGASIGAGAVCVAPLIIGKYSLIGAGSVVVKNVPDYGLVVGNPARQIGWVDKEGNRLVEEKPGHFISPNLNKIYRLIGASELIEVKQ
jgi:UDP-2-acetamido-3-amino-2,3-dideoxy-glucuronate N-acetyltransferase